MDIRDPNDSRTMSRRSFVAMLAGGAAATIGLVACASGAPATPTTAPAATTGAPPTQAPAVQPTKAAGGATPAATTAAQPTAAATTGTAQIQKGGTLVHASSQEPVNYNPLLYVNTGTETAIDQYVFSRLWNINDKGEFFPMIAAEVPSRANGGISEDGLTYTIKLRKDAKWHDGKPITARDIVFTFETIMSPKVTVRSQVGHDRVASFEPKDEYTVVAKLKEPFVPYLLAWQSMSPIPEHIFAKEPDINTSKYNTQPIGSGPFKFVERKAGDSITLEANEAYWLGAPHLGRIVYKYVPDLTVLYTQFKTGAIHVFGIQGVPADRVAEAKTNPNIDIQLTPSMYVEFIYFNLGKEMFKDKRVRQALYLAMDKDAWIEKVYFGIPKRTLSYLHPDHWAYNANLKDPGYDPRKAAELLDAAGWKVGPDGIRVKDGVKLSFTNSTTAGNKQREQAQQLIQQNLKQIGVDLQIKNMPASVVWGEYTTKSQFDTLMVGWEPTLFPDPDYTARCHSKQIPIKTGTGSNYVQYENPELDKLLEAGVREPEQEKRKQIYGKIQEILLEDLPFAPIFGYVRNFATLKSVQGYKRNPYVAENNWNSWEWWLKR